MAFDLVQWERYLMHITHEKNLPAILARGLQSKNDVKARNLAYVSIADDGIQSRRSVTPVPCGAGGTIHDYVPLFFGARSPMLYAVQRRTTQSEIVYILVNWTVLDAPGTVFTDGNASTGGTSFFSGREQLGNIDQTACRAIQWDQPQELRRKKSAECLVHRNVPTSTFGGLVVMSEDAKLRVERVAKARGWTLPIYVEPGWYY